MFVVWFVFFFFFSLMIDRTDKLQTTKLSRAHRTECRLCCCRFLSAHLVRGTSHGSTQNTELIHHMNKTKKRNGMLFCRQTKSGINRNVRAYQLVFGSVFCFRFIPFWVVCFNNKMLKHTQTNTQSIKNSSCRKLYADANAMCCIRYSFYVRPDQQQNKKLKNY